MPICLHFRPNPAIIQLARCVFVALATDFGGRTWHFFLPFFGLLLHVPRYVTVFVFRILVPTFLICGKMHKHYTMFLIH
jgi:hypothetical protein